MWRRSGLTSSLPGRTQSLCHIISCATEDLETGGLNPKRHPIIQLAAVALDGESLAAVETIEIKVAFDEARANKHAIRKNSYDRITWKNEALNEREAAFRFAEFLKRHASIPMLARNGSQYYLAQLVAHNAAFDCEFLHIWYERLESSALLEGKGSARCSGVCGTPSNAATSRLHAISSSILCANTLVSRSPLPRHMMPWATCVRRWPSTRHSYHVNQRYPSTLQLSLRFLKRDDCRTEIRRNIGPNIFLSSDSTCGKLRHDAVLSRPFVEWPGEALRLHPARFFFQFWV